MKGWRLTFVGRLQSPTEVRLPFSNLGSIPVGGASLDAVPFRSQNLQVTKPGKVLNKNYLYSMT